MSVSGIGKNGKVGGAAILPSNSAKAPSLEVMAWQKAQKTWGAANLYAPVTYNDPLTTPKELQGQLACYNFYTRKMEVNLPQIDQEIGLKYLPEIESHELGHRCWIPGDLKTFMLLTHAAKKVLNDDGLADLCRNLFDDIEDNFKLCKKGMLSIIEVYQKLWRDREDINPVQLVIGRAYEVLAQKADTSRFYKGFVTPPEKTTQEIETAANKIAGIFNNLQRLHWSASIIEFAKILKPFLERQKQESQSRMTLSNVTIQSFFPPGECPIPPEGEADIKKLEGRLLGIAKDLSPQEFGGFLAGNQIKLDPKKASAWYYRDLTRGKKVTLPEVIVKTGNLYPYTPLPAKPLDPRLEPLISFMSGGKLGPVVTPKVWEFKSGRHVAMGKDKPDLVLALDMSGSMEDPGKNYAPAVASSMIIAHSFLETKKSVYALAFSSGDPIATGKFSESEDEVDDVLVAYQEGGRTQLPYSDIEKPFELTKKEKYFVMITDLEIENIDIERLKNILKKSCGATIYWILRGEQKNENVKILEEIGYEVVPIKDISQLEGHALQLTKQLFEERLNYG